MHRATLLVASVALILAIVAYTTLRQSTFYNNVNNTVWTPWAPQLGGAQTLPIFTQWGGIDSGIPNPAHRIDTGMHNLDSAVTIYPAAVFHGSLSMQNGNLILDEVMIPLVRSSTCLTV